ncbi:MAG: glycosyltransferase [Proteobacteria bacterium]|nr:glycosyltransferase [Pseudomonadota bacterium]
MRVFLNLKAGLDRIGAAYRINNYRHIRNNPDDLACLIGKPHLLERFTPRTPLMFGTATYNHPIDDEHLPKRHLLRQVLVPSEWVKRMFSKVWPADLVSVWPVGIDTERWTPSPGSKDVDVLVYDKISRRRENHQRELIDPLMAELRCAGLTVEYLRYGSYVEWELLALSRRVRSMVYLSHHETQGIALEQMLSADVPVLAWEPGGDWQSHEYLQRGVRFSPVTSVPYWDERCGVKFTGMADLRSAVADFWHGVKTGSFSPRQLILDRGLTLEAAAEAYVALAARYAR